MPTRSRYPDVTIPKKSLSDLVLERISSYGSDIALVDNTGEKQPLTFKVVHEQICALANFLRTQEIKKGDVVGLCAPSCIEFPVVLLGIIASGGTACLCNADFSKEEMLSTFAISEPRMMFVHDSAIKIMKKVAGDITVEKIFVIGESEEFTTMESVVGSEVERDFPPNLSIDLAEDVAILVYSSGTTDLPKSVMLSHGGLVSFAVIYEDMTGDGRGECVFSERPMFHIWGMGVSLLSLFMGMKLIVDVEANTERILGAIEKHKVTRLLATPFIMAGLAKIQNHTRYDTTSLKQIQCGGAGLSLKLIKMVRDRYEVHAMPCYGLTEFSHVAINRHDDNQALASTGTISSNTIVKIVQLASGEEVISNMDGEILVKGPQMMKGYLKNPKATKATIDADGWMHTGDIGRVDENGVLYIVGRRKEIIQYKTFQVSPPELEGVIIKHPKVADAGVIGIPFPDCGEIPKAFVVKKDVSLTEQDITELVKEKLVDYKQLRGGVEFIAEVPRSKAGKVKRNELKKLSKLDVQLEATKSLDL